MIIVISTSLEILKAATITMPTMISRTWQWTKAVIVHQPGRGGKEGKTPHKK